MPVGSNEGECRHREPGPVVLRVVRIHTQQDMRRATDALRQCYLCGKDLQEKGGSVATLQREHVIPMSHLRLAKGTGDRFPVLARVHSHCDQTLKKRLDEAAGSILRIHGKPSEPLNRSDIAFAHSRLDMGVDGRGCPVPFIKDVGDVRDAASVWVRGFHALLYGVALQSDVRIRVVPPVPRAKVAEGRVIFIEQDGHDAAKVSTFMRVASVVDQWDGITAWGSTLEYKCVWVRPQRCRWWSCVWTLEYSATRQWSASVCEEPAPWFGSYFSNRLPATASRLSARDVKLWAQLRRG
jgi:hypothetical protein